MLLNILPSRDSLGDGARLVPTYTNKHWQARENGASIQAMGGFV